MYLRRSVDYIDTRMSWSNGIRDLYQKYDELIRFSAYAFSGWAISWVLFFVMLPFMIRYYGKIRGASMNYAFSWVSMFAIILGLEYTVG